MAKVLAELGLAELVTSIRGVSVVGAAAILAETGDPARFDDATAVVKHAGLCPPDNTSGAFAAKTTISGRVGRCCGWPPGGRCGRVAAQPGLRRPLRHLTSRQHNRLSDGQAPTAVAAALLRQLWVVCVNRIPWEPAVAGGTIPKEVTDPAAYRDPDAAG